MFQDLPDRDEFIHGVLLYGRLDPVTFKRILSIRVLIEQAQKGGPTNSDFPRVACGPTSWHLLLISCALKCLDSC